MKRTAALRVAGEICLYFSVLTLFPAFRGFQLAMAAFALACLVGLYVTMQAYVWPFTLMVVQ